MRVCAFAAVICLFLCSKVPGAPVSSSMVVEMTDITSVSRSPDGDTVVIGISHANPHLNVQELAWVIVQLHGGASSVTIPAGEAISDPVGPGSMLNTLPQWSPDSKRFYYLRRDGREVQLWGTDRDGRATRQLTHSLSNLVSLGHSSNSSELLVRLAPARDVLDRAEDEENRRGVLYDDHVIGGFPLTKTLPVIDRWRNIRRMDDGKWAEPGWSGTSTAIFDIRRNELRPAVEAVDDPCADNCVDGGDYQAMAVALGEVPSVNPDSYRGQFTLQIESKKGSRTTTKCPIAECTANRIKVLGWSPGDTEIYYVADSLQGRLGDRRPGRAAIYAWNPVASAVRLIDDPEGRFYNLKSASGLGLNSVPVTNGRIVLATAGADQPPRVDAIDLASGVSRTIFDPNPELRSQTRGRAVWHSWPTSTGYAGRGIVILPKNYVLGRRYPVVITTYVCGGGFLRGGGGDNVPEFVAADAGFVAICVDVPVREIGAKSDLGNLYPIMCDVVKSLIADEDRAGLIDPSRVGLSGQSLGANSAAYCLSHSKAFAAATLRSGSVLERAQWDLFDTAGWRRDPISGFYAQLHMPDPHDDPGDRWGKMSSANKAQDIDTRVLIQASDTEYLGSSLSFWSAMHEYHKAIEMYVFPRETHLLSQPIHQLVNDERQLDWFRYWLKDEKDDAPDKRPQYDRWDALRDSSQKAAAH
jgi:dipeptidyl aminopeptidase/acylaminoacyl peptidase